MAPTRPLAVVTGASTGIGYELAKLCAQNGFDLAVAADEPLIQTAAQEFQSLGAQTVAVEADLATPEGVDKLYDAVAGRIVDALIANAGTGLSEGFLDQEFAGVRRVIDTNVTGTLRLIHKIGNDMRRRGSGRILIVGSIAGYVPGAYHAVYNASKAFIDSFSYALREELEDTGVSVTCLMPGATETEFFERAGLTDTKLGQSDKMSAAEVAEIGFRAMMEGDDEIIAGWYNKVQTAMAQITPASILADRHAKQAKPGSGEKART